MTISHARHLIGTWRGAATPTVRPPVTLRGRGLLAARLAFLAYAALAVWLEVTRAVQAWRGGDVTAFAGGLTLAQLRDALAGTGLTPDTYLALAVGAALLGNVVYYAAAALLFRRRSDEAIALLVAAFLIATQANAAPPELFALMATEPLGATLGLVVTLVFAVLSLWLFFLFPDGRFVPRWTIVIAAIWALQNASDFFVVRDVSDNGPLAAAVEYAVAALAVIVAQTYRYRRVSGPIERQQAKWFLGGLGVFFVIFAAGNLYLGANGLLTTDAPPQSAIPWLIVTLANAVGGFALAGALAVAVLRYRLFAIDALINRTLVYGGLTTAVIGLYVLIVGYLGTLLHTTGNLPISLVATGVVAVLFQPLRGWLQRGANRLLYGERDEPYAVLSRLGRQLEGTLAPEAILTAIVETIAGALRLPYVAIALRDGDALTFAAGAGSATSAATEVVPLSYQGERMGELRLTPRPGEPALAPADRRLLDDLARQAGIAVHAMELTRDLQRARARLVAAREEERRRLRRDLHDGLGPTLASQALAADTAALLLETGDPQAAAALLREMKAQAQAAVGEIRRVVYALRPPALDDLGLAGALREAAGRYMGDTLTIAVRVPAPLPALSAAVEVATYRIAQEALTNVARHAHARRCTVTLTVGAALELVVADDGVGVPVDRRAGVGLTSMRERAEELGGACTIEAEPGGGTRVAARLPLE